MKDPRTTLELTAEQQNVLDESGGVVQGESFVLMRPDVVLSYFGYDSIDELRRELQPAIEQADRGDLEEWNVEEFLNRMHRRHDTKAE